MRLTKQTIGLDFPKRYLMILARVLIVFEGSTMTEFDLPIRKKLTKTLLMRLPTGVFLVSNTQRSIGPNTVTPVFAEKVVPFDDREWQWRRIKECGADGRTCEVHTTSEEYKKTREVWTKMSDKWPRLVLLEVDDPKPQ